MYWLIRSVRSSDSIELMKSCRNFKLGVPWMIHSFIVLSRWRQRERKKENQGWQAGDERWLMLISIIDWIDSCLVSLQTVGSTVVIKIFNILHNNDERLWAIRPSSMMNDDRRFMFHPVVGNCLYVQSRIHSSQRLRPTPNLPLARQMKKLHASPSLWEFQLNWT